MSRPDLEYYCELIAALKLRTTNKAGRHLSTGRAIQLLEEYGVETRYRSPNRGNDASVSSRSWSKRENARWHCSLMRLMT